MCGPLTSLSWPFGRSCLPAPLTTTFSSGTTSCMAVCVSPITAMQLRLTSGGLGTFPMVPSFPCLPPPVLVIVEDVYLEDAVKHCHQKLANFLKKSFGPSSLPPFSSQKPCLFDGISGSLLKVSHAPETSFSPDGPYQQCPPSLALKEAPGQA